MEKKTVIVNLLLILAVVLEHSFYGWPFFASAVFCVFFLSKEFTGISKVAFPAFIYDALSLKRFGLTYLVIITSGIALVWYKRLFGSSFISFIFGSFVFYAGFYSFMLIPNIITFQLIHKFLPSYLIFFGSAIFWRGIFTIIKIGEKGKNIVQLHF